MVAGKKRLTPADDSLRMPAPPAKKMRIDDDAVSTVTRGSSASKRKHQGPACGRCATEVDVLSVSEPVDLKFKKSSEMDNDTEPSKKKAKGKQTAKELTAVVHACKKCFDIYDIGGYKCLGLNFTEFCTKCTSDGEFNKKIENQLQVASGRRPRTWDNRQAKAGDKFTATSHAKFGFVVSGNFRKVFDTPLSVEDAKQDVVQWSNAFGKMRDGVFVRLPEPLIEEIDISYAKGFKEEEMFQNFGTSLYPE